MARPPDGPAGRLENLAVSGLPTRIVIAGHTFEVREVSDPTEGLHRHGTHEKVGLTDMSAGRIIVRTGPENSAHNARDTTLHEVIHAVLSLAGLDEQVDVFKSARMSERLVEVLATHLLDTLRRNAELSAYLLEADDA